MFSFALTLCLSSFCRKLDLRLRSFLKDPELLSGREEMVKKALLVLELKPFPQYHMATVLSSITHLISPKEPSLPSVSEIGASVYDLLKWSVY